VHSKEELLALAASSTSESEFVDYKRDYSPEKKSAFWAEIVKDIVAFANTKGGVLVFGLEDDGTDSLVDCSNLLRLDQAALVDQVRKYTDHNHSGLHISEIHIRDTVKPCIVVEPISIPLVFTRVGTYEAAPGLQKTAFSVGTIYVRHGSKSEHCSRSDLQHWIQAEIQRQRDLWLGNIRKVVEAEPGSSIVVLSPSQVPSASPFRITNDPSAPTVRLQKLSDEYPFRQSDIIGALNKRLSESCSINTHDIQTIKEYLGINPVTTPQYLHKPHDKASPQYSLEFIVRVMTEYEKDPDFFNKCREKWKSVRYGYDSLQS
jgi:hypothetical protein